jgi:hypothetical protein
MILNIDKLNLTGTTYSVVSPDIYEEYKKTKNAELFEGLVHDLILNKYSDCEETNEFILSLPKKEQRLAIMSLVDKDTKGDANLLWSEMKAYVDSRTDKMDHVKDVIRIINKFVKDGSVEKKTHGEVMTPISLVREMLDTLPKEVWSNPHLKWLDPCNGAGTFPFVVIYKLMIGLSEWEPNIEKRYKHIVENMIYTCELQSRNVFLWLCGVDPFDEYTTNTYWGSFLDEGFDRHMKNVWGLDKVDICLGNPPYNTGTTGGNGGRDLWDKFLIKSEIIVKENGFIVYVHPPKWRKPENNLFNLFKKNNLVYLEIHNKQDGQKIFNAITRYDFYCLQKTKYNGKTIIKDELGKIVEINLDDWDWLPNFNFDIFEKIISNENNLEIIYSRSLYGNDKRWMSKNQNDINMYPCIYGMYKDGSFSLYHSSENKGHFGIPKIIIPCAEKPYTLLDINGDYGIMQNAFGIKISDDNYINVKKAIDSDKFLEVIKASKWLNFQIDYKMFKSFSKDFWKEFI